MFFSSVSLSLLTRLLPGSWVRCLVFYTHVGHCAKWWPKRDTGTFVSFVITAIFCMWLVWVCAWLHQWHPLIMPQRAVHGEGRKG